MCHSKSGIQSSAPGLGNPFLSAVDFNWLTFVSTIRLNRTKLICLKYYSLLLPQVLLDLI